LQAETDRVASDVTGARQAEPSQVQTAPPAITWVARDTGEDRLALAKEPSACATEKAASDRVAARAIDFNMMCLRTFRGGKQNSSGSVRPAAPGIPTEDARSN